MTISEHSEPQTSTAQAPQGLPPAMDASSNEAPPTNGLAADSDIQHIQEQLRALTARADAMDAEATRLQQESSGSEAGDVEQARSQAQAMRGAAEQAQAAIAAAPRDERTGKKRITLTRLEGISALIQRVTIESDKESSDLGAARSEGQTHTAQRASSQASTNARSSMAARTGVALFGRNVSSAAGAAGHDNDDDEPEFAPQMDRRDRRNSDGRVSGREAVGGAVGLGRAVFSRRRRATAARIVGEISTAAENDDQRGMLDGSLSVGRGVARVTGSDDVGHVATVVVGTAATKSNTAWNLLGNFDISGAASALSRNLSAAGGAATDMVGANTLANNIRPLLGRLMSDRGIDFENLVNSRRVKQFDTDGNGRLDASEIIGVLRNNGVASMDAIDTNNDDTIQYNELRAQLYAIARRNNARVEGRAVADAPARNPNQGRIVGLDGHGRITIERARAILQEEGVRIDANRDGTVTYGECLAAITQWNNTHNASGQPVAAAPARRTVAPTRGN